MSEFIGSRISLISKSDIRYVGTLHEINSENSTVALEQVTSYGTEGRRGNPDDEVPASNELYEYIVFRGSDVKDLRIEEAPKENKPPPPQVPNDPAILGSGSRPPPQRPAQQSQGPLPGAPPNFQQPPPFPYQQYGQYPQQRFGGQPGRPGPGFPGAPGAFQGYPGMPYGAPPGWYPPPPGQGFPQPPEPFYPHHQMPPFNGHGPQQDQQQQASTQKSGLAMESQTETSKPSEESQKLAVNLPVTTAKTQKPKSDSATPAPETQSAAAPPSPPNATKPDTAAALAPPAPTATKPIPLGPKSGKIVPAIPLANSGAKSSPKAAVNTTETQKQTLTVENNPPTSIQSGHAAASAALQYQNATQAATAAVAAAMAKLPPLGGHTPKQSGDGEAMDNLTRKVNEMRTDDRIRHSRQPGTGGYAVGHRGGRGGRGRGGHLQGKALEVPRTDFDFESANAQFNKKDVVKEAIASGSPLGTPTDGEAAQPLSVNDSTANNSNDVVIPTATKVYNKSSFFDNISSEAKDREDTDGKRAGQEFRSEERRRNMETFGLGSVDGQHRGGLRGRGRGRGGFRGGFGRGGGPRGGVFRGRDGADGASSAIPQKVAGV